MSIEKVAILMSCEGQLVSMNSFLSTTRDRNYALALVESGSNRLDELKSVLFEIDLDRDLSKMKPYADISRESAIQSEDEVLIMLGSVFRLNSIYSENDGLFNFHCLMMIKRAVILFRNVEHCGISSAPGINSEIGSNPNSVRFRNSI
jgi:hypothetical protein